MRIAIPKSFRPKAQNNSSREKTKIIDEKKSKEALDRFKAEQEFTELFREEHHRRSRGLDEESATPDSYIDRIDTKKLGVSDIFDGSSLGGFKPLSVKSS